MSAPPVRLGDQFNPARWPIRFALPDNAADLKISAPRLELHDGGQYLSCQFDTRFVMHPVEDETLVIRIGSERCAVLLMAPPGNCPAYFRTDQTTLALSSHLLLPGDPAPAGSETVTIEVTASKLQVTPTGLTTTLTGTWTVPADDLTQAPMHFQLWPTGPDLALTSLEGSISKNRITTLGGKAKARIALLPNQVALDLAWQVSFDGRTPKAFQGRLSMDRVTTLPMPGLGLLEISRLEGTAVLSRSRMQVQATLSGRWAQAGVTLSGASCHIDASPEGSRLHLQFDSIALTHLPAPLSGLELRDAHLTLIRTDQQPAGQIEEAELHGMCLWSTASTCCTLPPDVGQPAPGALVRLTLHWSGLQPPTLKLSLDVSAGLTGLFDDVVETWRPRDVAGVLRCTGTLQTGTTPLVKVSGQATISLKAPPVLAGNAGPGLAATPANAAFSAKLTFSPGRFKLIGMARTQDTDPPAEMLLRLPPLGSASLRSTELEVQPAAWRLKGSGTFQFGLALASWLKSTEPWTCDLTAGGQCPHTSLDDLNGTLEGGLTLDLPTLNAASTERISLVTLSRLTVSIHRATASSPGTLKLRGQATLLDSLSVPTLLEALQPGPLRPLLEPLLSALVGADLLAEIEAPSAPASSSSDDQPSLTLRLTASAPASAQPFSLLGALAALTGQPGPITPPTIRIGKATHVLDELFAVRTRQVVFTLETGQQHLTAALTLELNVLGRLFEVTATIGQHNGKPRTSILLGDTTQGGEPIVLRIPTPGANDLNDLIDRVATSLALDHRLVQGVATTLEQFMKAGPSMATLELCDIGIECSADTAGNVLPRITGTVQMLEMPAFLGSLMPGGFFFTLSSNAEGVKISSGTATTAPLLHLPLDKGSPGKPARTIDLFLDSLAIGYRWTDNSISLGCSAGFKTVPPDLLTLNLKGTGVRVQTPVAMDVDIGLMVTPPPLPVPRWNFRFDVPASTTTGSALDQLGAQIFLGDDGTRQFGRVWFRHCTFSPIGWMFCPTLTYDAGFVLGGPSPASRNATGKPVYTSAADWITALNTGRPSTDTFHLHASLEGLTAILVSPTTALVMNPLVFLPTAPPMPPFWVGPNPIGPLADFYFDRVSASIHLPGFLHGSLRLERPLPEVTLETLLSLAALMASGFQASIPPDSPLHRLFYASATVEWWLPFGGSTSQRLSVAVDMVQALEGLGDLVKAVQDVTETVTDLVQGLPELRQRIEQSPTLAVRLIPRESRQFTLDLDIALLGNLTVSASLVLLTPEECAEELALFHESKRRSRARAPRAGNAPPPVVVKPVVENDWRAPVAGRLTRAVSRIVADDEAEDPTPLAHALRQQQEWSAELAAQICRTRWSESSKRAGLLDDWMISRSKLDDLEKLLLAEWRRVPDFPALVPPPTAIIAPETRAGDRMRIVVYRWLMRNRLIRHPYLEARRQMRQQVLPVMPVPVVINVPAGPKAALPPVGTLPGLRLPGRVLDEMKLRDRLQASLNLQMKARLAAAPFVMVAPKPANRQVSLDLRPVVETLQKKLPIGELKIRPIQPGTGQVADRTGPFDLYLTPPGKPSTRLLQGIPRGRLWTVRRVGDRYQLKVLGDAPTLATFIDEDVVKQAGSSGTATPALTIAALRAWIRPQDRLMDATSAARLFPAAASFSNPWESQPTLYQQSIFFRDEYRITENSRHGDVVGRRGGVYFADMLHTMSGGQHCYVTPTSPVLMAGFDATLWNQKLHFAGLIAPEQDGAALFMVARAELAVELAEVELHFEGDLTLLSGSIWADQTRPGMNADSLSFSGVIDCQVGEALSIDMEAKGVLTRRPNGLVEFGLQVRADMTLKIPVISVTLWGITYRFRIAADVSLDGELSNRSTGLTFKAEIKSIMFDLQQRVHVNGRAKWQKVASVSVSGQLRYDPRDGLQATVGFDVPSVLAGPAEYVAGLSADDAFIYRNGKLTITCELD